MFKKLALGCLFVFCLTSLSHGFLFDQIPDKSVVVNYSLSVAAGTISTTTVVIDLSDTTNWPHIRKREINISTIRMGVDMVAHATATVKLGVVNTINSSTGSVTWFHTYRKDNSTSGVTGMNDNSIYNPSPSFIRCRVNGGTNYSGTEGTTPYILSNDKTTGSTTYQTDVVLPNPYGTDAAPGIGDIVVDVVTDGTNAAVVEMQLIYHSER